MVLYSKGFQEASKISQFQTGQSCYRHSTATISSMKSVPTVKLTTQNNTKQQLFYSLVENLAKKYSNYITFP